MVSSALANFKLNKRLANFTPILVTFTGYSFLALLSAENGRLSTVNHMSI